MAASATFAQAGTLNIVYSEGMPGITGNLDVTESINNGLGVYDVTNNTNGSLRGFGVSNNGTLPGLYNNDGNLEDFGCSNDDSNTFFHCYSAIALTEDNWNTETIGLFDSDFSLTFQDIFGSFASVAGSDSVFNWYVTVDGDLQDGTSESGFFGFEGLDLASNIIGVSGNQGGTAAFTAGSAGGPSQVPLPAAGWLLIAGLGGMAALKRRKKS